MGKLKEEKVFRDPIAGYVRVDDEVIWNCINAKEFQRLRRIRQLGSTSVVFHTGEHSRFSHSLGVYEIARRMVSEVEDIVNSLTEYEKTVVKLAALLHDIGHAPFSHSFERILNCDHEKYTENIIKGPSEINDVLFRENSSLPDDVAAVINGNSKNTLLIQMISSQLDCDRMDYLLRDSYFTGTSYGQFDLERVLRTLRVYDNHLAVKASGVHTIEDYIMARYHMYWQVYYHPVSRSFDVMLNKVFERLVYLYRQDSTTAEKYPMFKALLENKVLTNNQHYHLDDNTCYYAFTVMQESDDKILADLATRLVDRKMFGYCNMDREDEIKNKLIEKGYDLAYYFYKDSTTQVPYQPYSGKKENSIWILSENDGLCEISQYSKVVRALCFDQDDQDNKIFFPKEVLTND